jgi:pimeloyl-ACP methyl ester carboxylesterase
MGTGKINQTITLRDGRTLGFAEYGDSGGKPVLHFHGSSSSRLERPPDRSMMTGVRLITVDRPGHGLSDFQPERRLLDWPDDVTTLVDYLEIDKFAVSGWSMGGPYVMACAYEIPERLTAVGAISSFAPYDRPEALKGVSTNVKVALRMARWLPFWFLKQFMSIQGRIIQRDPEKAANQILSSIPNADREALADPRALEVLLPAMSEAFRCGPAGAAWEPAMLVRPWGFRLGEITIPVHIWHGEIDANNPLQYGKYLQESLPNSQVTFYPGEGHFFILKRWGEILETLVA